MITTQKDLRKIFHDQFNIKRKYINGRPATQNDYPTDVRLDWIDFIESMRYQGLISDSLADRATL